MARVTVEDCVTKVPNRFNLVMLASQRARNISAGGQLTVERDNDKNPVVALREIAIETVELAELEESLIKSLQTYVEMDEPEEEEMDLLAIQQEVSGGEIEAAGEAAAIDLDDLIGGDSSSDADAGGEIFAVIGEADETTA